MECEGAVAVYHNSILLAYDTRFNGYHYDAIPAVKIVDGALNMSKIDIKGVNVAYSIETVDGNRILLCDFESAGQTGSFYNTWINYK